MMTLDLNLLLTLEALDKARSVSGAARLLGLSQPATSAALGRLRKALGDELYTYAGGAMQPTPTARRLVPGVHQALKDLRALLDEERTFDPTQAHGCFTIGVTDYASAVIGPALARLIAREAPGFDLRLTAYDKTGVAALIDSGAIDVAIGSFAEPPERAVATPLMTECLVGVARLGHPAHRQALDAEGFAALDHALFTQGRDMRGAVDDALAALGLQRRVRLTLPHLMALPEILRTTDLVAAVPARATTLFGPDVATFDIGFLAMPPWTLHMLWSPFLRRDRAHAWLRKCLAAVCAAL